MGSKDIAEFLQDWVSTIFSKALEGQSMPANFVYDNAIMEHANLQLRYRNIDKLK